MYIDDRHMHWLVRSREYVGLGRIISTYAGPHYKIQVQFKYINLSKGKPAYRYELYTQLGHYSKYNDDPYSNIILRIPPNLKFKVY